MSVAMASTPVVLFTEQEIAKRVMEMGREIRDDLEDVRDVIVLCVLKGAVFFCTDLMRAMKLGAKLDFIQASSYGSGTESSGVVEFLKEPQVVMTGKTVLIVEDILDSGLTLRKIDDYVAARGAERILTAVFLDKPKARKVPFQADYVGFEIEPHFVVGYGLDHAEAHRDCPEIRILPG